MTRSAAIPGAMLVAWLAAGCECARSHELDAGADASPIDATSAEDVRSIDASGSIDAVVDDAPGIDAPAHEDAPSPADAHAPRDARGPIDAGATCVELDDPFLVARRPEDPLASEAPEIAWGGGRWAVLALRLSAPPDHRPDPHAVIYERAADGTALGPVRVLEPGAGHTDAVAWADGRWAIGVGDRVTPDVHVGLFDADFASVGGWRAAGAAPSTGMAPRLALARLSSVDRWVAIWQRYDALVVHGVSDAAIEGPVEHPIVGAMRIHAVGFRDRAVVLVPGDAANNEILVIGGPPSYAALGRIGVRGRWGRSAGIAAVADRAVAVGIEAGALMTAVADPVMMTLTAGERAIDAVPGDRFALGAAGSEAHGIAAVCWGGSDMSPGVPIAIHVSLVGLDGELRGAPALATETAFRSDLPNCAIAADDDGFLVAWWDGQELWARRVRVAC